MRSKSEILETLSRLEQSFTIVGFVHDGAMLGVPASDDVIVSIGHDQHRYTWKELDAFLEGVKVAKYLTPDETDATLQL